MRSTLRILFLTPVVMAAAVLATHTAQAEVTVKVPFNFSVAGKQCPAGLYSVNSERSLGLIKLQSKDSFRSFTWLLIPGNDAPKDGAVVLKFNQDGQNHALESVQYGSMTTPKLNKHAIENEYVSAPLGQGR